MFVRTVNGDAFLFVSNVGCIKSHRMTNSSTIL